jgi:hypothetical protein
MSGKIDDAELKKLRAEVNSIYTPLSVAKKEIWRRWNDKELIKKEKKFFKNNIPEIFKKEPLAAFARHVTTPNFEHNHFFKKAAVLGLKPICLEYLSDRFVTNNAPKFHLGKMYFLGGRGKNGGGKVNCIKLINFDKSAGCIIKKVNTIETNIKLIDLHHNLTDYFFPTVNRYDISSWYMENGKLPNEYYKYLLALFIRRGIIFDNFLLNDEEIDFTKNIVLSSIEKVINYFGVKPLIVKLLPENSESENHWYWYPMMLEVRIKSFIANKN